MPSKFLAMMRQDEVFRAEMPGSGGHGDAFRRDPQAVSYDVRLGKLSPGHALAAYGVVVDKGGTVDLEATRLQRAAHAKGNAPGARGQAGAVSLAEEPT